MLVVDTRDKLQKLKNTNHKYYWSTQLFSLTPRLQPKPTNITLLLSRPTTHLKLLKEMPSLSEFVLICSRLGGTDIDLLLSQPYPISRISRISSSPQPVGIPLDAINANNIFNGFQVSTWAQACAFKQKNWCLHASPPSSCAKFSYSPSTHRPAIAQEWAVKCLPSAVISVQHFSFRRCADNGGISSFTPPLCGPTSTSITLPLITGIAQNYGSNGLVQRT